MFAAAAALAPLAAADAECLAACQSFISNTDEKVCMKKYNHQRPPSLVSVCIDSWRAGAHHACDHFCVEKHPCIGVHSVAHAERDHACRQYGNSLPRPLVSNICKDSWVKGLEERCIATQRWAQARADALLLEAQVGADGELVAEEVEPLVEPEPAPTVAPTPEPTPAPPTPEPTAPALRGTEATVAPEATLPPPESAAAAPVNDVVAATPTAVPAPAAPAAASVATPTAAAAAAPAADAPAAVEAAAAAVKAAPVAPSVAASAAKADGAAAAPAAAADNAATAAPTA